MDFKAKYELTTSAQFILYGFLFTFVPNYWLAVAEKENRNEKPLNFPFLTAHLVHLLFGSFYLSLLSAALCLLSAIYSCLVLALAFCVIAADSIL